MNVTGALLLVIVVELAVIGYLVYTGKGHDK